MDELEGKIETACRETESWLRALPEWHEHPASTDGQVSGNYGPTILSEADCTMHFARHLYGAGVPWQDMHFELSGSKWIFAPPREGAYKWRTDLAIIGRDRLIGTDLPDMSGRFEFDAFFEFALGSNYWKFGRAWGAPKKIREKVSKDVDKVAKYTDHRLCAVGYVIVFEECDHEFPSDYVAEIQQRHPGVRVRILRGWGD